MARCFCETWWVGPSSPGEKPSGTPLTTVTNSESFFALLQKNVLNTRRWATREELRLAIVTWIETRYNRRRRRLGRLTPVEFEMVYTTAHAA